MTLPLTQLADHLGASLRGNGDVLVDRVTTLSDAGPGAVSFFSNARYRCQLASCKASAIILAEADATQAPTAALVVKHPYLAYAKAVELLHPRENRREGIHPLACVDASALVDSTAWIGAHSIIEANARVGAGTQIGSACTVGTGVQIGSECDLIARVTVLAGACLGDRVMLHPGVVIGSDGFGQASTGKGWKKVPQIGSVRIADDVEIGANSCVDRGALGDTVIETGVRIDNQVQIAHNVFIGAHTAIAACVGISGSVKIGQHCTFAGGVGLVGHLTIADHVDITGMSMVTHSIGKAGSYSSGTPLMGTTLWRKNAVRIKSLDALFRRLMKYK